MQKFSIFFLIANFGFCACFYRSPKSIHTFAGAFHRQISSQRSNICGRKPLLDRKTSTMKANILADDNSMISQRLKKTERPYIEDVLDKYADLPNITKLALGSSYWGPPQQALEATQKELFETTTHKYNSILGMDELRDKIRETLLRSSNGVFPNVDDHIVITAGANQAIINIALTLCDPKDEVVILSPYYFSHLLAFQLADANVRVCPFNPSTLTPNWDVLDTLLDTHKPKAIVLTNPNNPSGKVWSKEELLQIVQRCSQHDCYLILDQTYYEFLYNEKRHIFPSKGETGYDKVISVFSMSKVFGMPGWRVGFIVCPSELLQSMRKIQDTIPTHASVLSQKLASRCLETYDVTSNSNPWFASHLSALANARSVLWPILEPLGTVQTDGAFYFLVPIPPKIGEEEAVDILAKKFDVLLMHGSPFGADGYLRLSYGSIPPSDIIAAADKLRQGFAYLQDLSKQR